MRNSNTRAYIFLNIEYDTSIYNIINEICESENAKKLGEDNTIKLKLPTQEGIKRFILPNVSYLISFYGTRAAYDAVVEIKSSNNNRKSIRNASKLVKSILINTDGVNSTLTHIVETKTEKTLKNKISTLFH